jgi:hypothetical protein
VELPFAGIPRQHRAPDGFKPCIHCNSLKCGALIGRKTTNA